jgi:S1-C subfamily serine protease
VSDDIPEPIPPPPSGPYRPPSWVATTWQGLPTPLPPSPPRPRRAPAIIAFLLALAVFAGAFGLGHDDLVTNGSTGGTGSPTVLGNQNRADVSGLTSKVTPGVVNINTTLAQNSQAAGTGMVISSDGLVLTNNHVIDGATNVQVEIGGNGSSYSAKVLGYDITNDVALVQIKGVSNLKTVPFGDSAGVAVDDAVIAIGNALGRGGSPTVSQGVVAALDQTITAGDDSGSTETLHGLIQIQAAIQPGDSGGPLVNSHGDVVGMNTAAATTNGFRQSTSNIAFAIPINTARAIAAQIALGKSSSTVHIGARGIIGISVRDAAQGQSGSRAGNGSTSGAFVMQVQSGSPARDAGMVGGDVITAVANQTVTSVAQLNTAMDQYHPGDKVNLTWVDASGDKHSANITLIEGPPA